MTSPLPALLDSLYEKVATHCGSSLLPDDCTMLAVRRPLPQLDERCIEPRASRDAVVPEKAPSAA